jgi:hypothetical protein
LIGRPGTTETAWTISIFFIKAGDNKEENYITLIRYYLFIKSFALYAALLELVDGGEVGANLYSRVAERFGIEIQDQIFSGIGVAPLGTLSSEKPVTLHQSLNGSKKKLAGRRRLPLQLLK